MKNRLNKLLSIIISLILVSTSAIPILQQVAIAAATEEQILQATNDLRNGWKKITQKEELLLDQFFISGNSWSISESTSDEINGTTYPVYKYKYDATSSKSFIVSSGTNINFTSSTISDSDYDQIYMYYKSVSNNATPKFSIANTNWKSISVDATAPNGTWQKFDIKSAIDNRTATDRYFDGTDGNYIMRLQLSNPASFTSEITFSQIFGAKAIDFIKEFGFDINDTSNSLTKLVAYAKSIDISKYGNTDDFSTALANALQIVDSREVATEQLKYALKSINHKEQLILDQFFISGNSWSASESTSGDINGTTYPVYKYKYDAASSKSFIVSSGTNINFTSSTISDSDYNQIYMYYKSVSDNATPKFSITNTSWKSISVDAAAPNETWQKFDIKAAIDNRTATDRYFDGTDGNYIMRIQLSNPASFASEIMFSQVFGVKKMDFVKEFGFDYNDTSLMLEELVVLAKKINLNNYSNTELLSKAIDYAMTLIGAENLAIFTLKVGWKKITSKEELLLDKFFISGNSWSMSEGMSDDINGTTYPVYKYKYDATSSKSFIVSSGTNINFTSSTISDSDYSQIYMYYKTASGNVTPKFSIVNTSWKSINVDAATPNETWQKFDIKTAIDNRTANDRYFDGTDGNYIMRIQLSNPASFASEIMFSQVFGVKKMDFVKEFGFDIDNNNLSNAQLVAKAAKVDISKYSNTSDFVEALETVQNIYKNNPDYVADMIRKAWGNLKYAPKTILSPTLKKSDGTWVNSGFKAYSELGDASCDSDNIGTYFTNYNLKKDIGNLGFSSSTTKIRDGSTYDHSNFKDLYLYYKVDRNVTIDAYMTLSLSSSDWKVYSVTENLKDKGTGWNKLDIDISKLSSLTNIEIAQLFTTNPQLDCNIIVGSLICQKQFPLIDNAEQMNLAELVAAANKIDYSILDGRDAELDKWLVVGSAICERNGIFPGESTGCNASDINQSLLSNNLLSDATVEINFSSNGSDYNSVEVNALKALYDGSLEGMVLFNNSIHSNENAYTDLIFTLKGIADLSNISIVNPALQSLRASKYEIFMSSSRDSLFSDINRFYSYNNDNPPEVQNITYNYYKPSVQYIALRVYNPTSGSISGPDNYLRLREFIVGGSYNFYKVDTTPINENIISTYGNSLVANNAKNGKIVAGSKKTLMSDVSNAKILTDGKLDTIFVDYSTQQTSENFDINYAIYWKLDGTYRINKFYLASQINATTSNSGLLIGKYEVYASEDQASLFYPKNRIASYDNTVNSTNGSTGVQVFTANGDGAVARYIAIKITEISNDWETCVKKNQVKNCVPRIADIGIYGTPYVKPIVPTNLLQHVPLEIYRTDNDGRHYTVSDDEYGFDKSSKLYDGDYLSSQDIARNGYQLDFVFNICNNAKIDEIYMYTVSDNIKSLNIYASNVKDEIFDDESLIYKYSTQTADINEIGEAFENLTAKYIRFSVVDTNSDIVDVSEFEAIGGSDQGLNYTNIVVNNSSLAQVFTQEKDTGKVEFVSEEKNRWSANSRRLVFSNIVDDDDETVYDICVGEKNKKSMNIVFDLNGQTAVDNITFKSGASEKYFPNKINFYVASDLDEILSNDVTPIAKFDTKSADGIYSKSFTSKNASYVRIEVIDNDMDYYVDNKLITVVKEIAVNGLVLSENENDTVASFTDPSTGIIVDILKLNENDSFEKAQGIKVERRKPTDNEIRSASGIGVSFGSDYYIVTIIDSRGKPLKDLGGRLVNVYFPIPEFLDLNSAYIAKTVDSEFTLAEKSVNIIGEKHYVYTQFEDVSLMECAIVYFGSDEENSESENRQNSSESNGTYEPDDTHESNDTINDPDEENDNDTTETIAKRKKYLKRIRKATGLSGTSIALISVAAVVGIGGIVLVIVFRKKIFKTKKSKN